MALNNIQRQFQTRKSDAYDDTLPAGQVSLETNSTNLEYDENAKRSQISRLLDATGATRWYSDIPTVNTKKRSIKQLNEDLNAIENIQLGNDQFIPTFGQTAFVLSQAPIDPNEPLVKVNGQDLTAGLGFTVSGTILNILLPYDLDNLDHLTARYQYSL